MAYEKIAKLVDKLLEKTEEGSIQWEETTDEGVYQASFPGYTVKVRTLYRDRNDVEDYIVQILNENGATIESVSDVDMKGFLTEPFKAMRRLYDGARRRAMGVDEALDKILSKLEERDIPF